MSLKAKLSKAKRKFIKRVQVDGELVDLRRPTNPELLDLFDAAKEAGEVDEARKPTSERGGLRLGARVVAAVAHDPETGERIYDPANPDDLDEVYKAPWLPDVQLEALAALNPSIEEVRGNS